jgi:hypothetical protein
MEKIKNISKISIGSILLILAGGLFFIDRFLLVFLPWITGPSMRTYYTKKNMITESMWRVGAAFGLWLLWKLFWWLV